MVYARFTRAEVQPEKIDEVIKLWEERALPMLKASQGYQRAYFLVDRNSRKCISISVWDSEADSRANEQSAERQAVLALFEGYLTGTPTIEGYELIRQD